MNRIDKLRLKFIKWKYDKLIDEQYKRHKEMERARRDFLIEEVDRKLERSQELIDKYSKVFKET